MRHVTGLITPARALHRVLVLELANTTIKSHSNALLFSPSALSIRTSRSAHTQCSTRTRRLFSTTPAAQRAPQSKKRYLRNEKIPYHWVRVADEAGVLSAPQPINRVIASLPEGHNLIMVAPPPEEKPSSSPSSSSPGGPVAITPPAPVCRIENTALKLQLEAEARAREAEERAAAPQTKTLELNWAIAPHDLSHKMKRLGEFLGKGMRVEILLARKKGSRKATAEEERALVKTIRDTALGVPGSGEFKKPDGRVGGVLMMFFEGPRVARKGKKEKKDKKKERENGEVEGEVEAEV